MERISEVMSPDPLQFHCEERSRALYTAFEAVLRLDPEGRAAVLKALHEDRDLPLREDMARYRKALARALGRQPYPDAQSHTR
jgi:hypothetical protein